MSVSIRTYVGKIPFKTLTYNNEPQEGINTPSEVLIALCTVPCPVLMSTR